MVASATTITDEREETVDFTNPYYLPSAQSILVTKGTTDIKSEKDLDGKTVGVQQGTTGEEYVEEETDAGEVRTFPQGPDTIPALKAGTIDAVVIDRPVAERVDRGRRGDRNLRRDRNGRTVWIRRSRRATKNCSTNSTER